MVLRSVYWYGVQGYEGIMADLWVRLCQHSRAVLEVGGNVGFYTVLGARKRAGSYAVLEPLPELASEIRKNLALNRVEGVQVYQAAAIPSAQEEMVVLNVPSEISAMTVGAHLVIGTEVSGRRSERTVSVPGKPFAQVVQGCDLVKIDAEGVEAVLLESAQAEIEKSRPTLVVELLPESTHLAELLRSIAERMKYRIFTVPAYGSDEVVELALKDFSSRSPIQHRSKDVILTDLDLAGLLGNAGR